MLEINALDDKIYLSSSTFIGYYITATDILIGEIGNMKPLNRKRLYKHNYSVAQRQPPNLSPFALINPLLYIYWAKGKT